MYFTDITKQRNVSDILQSFAVPLESPRLHHIN